LKISVISINYNDSAGIDLTIRSVIEQTYNQVEYIVIDGGSTDGSKDKILKFQDSIDYWISEPDNGIYNAINKGLKKASGDYILVLNSGDVFYTDKILDEVVKELSTGEDIIFGDSFDVNFPNGIPDFIRRYPKNLSFDFFKKGALRHQSTFIKKELHDRVGLYDEELKIVSDWKFMLLAIAKHGASYKHVDKVICKYDRNGISSTNLELNKKEREEVLNENFPFYSRKHEPISYYKEPLRIRDILKWILPSGILELYSKRKKHQE
jgi:glycosyltransferase involved in cell wall biosynthesis